MDLDSFQIELIFLTVDYSFFKRMQNNDIPQKRYVISNSPPGGGQSCSW